MKTLKAIKGARLFDGIAMHRGEVLLLVDGQRIVGIGGSAPAGAEVVDLGAVTLLPGLVDTHVHLAFDASADPVAALAGRDDAEVFAAMCAAGRRAVPKAAAPPEMVSRLPRLVANAARMVAAGATIVVGSGAGIGPIKPHDVLRDAPAHLVGIGLSPAAALTAITARAASAIGLGSSKGRPAEGYDADVLAVDGDPTTDLAALHRIRAVYRLGDEVT